MPADRIEATLLLVGDPGVPAADDPVLAAIRATVDRAPHRVTVVFLGDNVYPSGMPPTGDRRRPEAERRLGVVLAAARGAAHIVFIPGNHDWRGGDDGWDAVRRQAEAVNASGIPGVAFVPADGCPGPDTVAVAGVRLIALDTQWWLHDGPRPVDPTSTCAADAPGEITARLRVLLLADTTRPAVVVGHHPLLSGGVHGGYFTWKDHLFPLTALKPWAWLPLPLLGSAYPVARSLGISAQDASAGAYRAMRDSVAAALAARPPLLYAAGHDHNLQVLDGAGWGAATLVVSGAGAYGHTGSVAQLPATRYARSASGFVRLDIGAGGVRLAVIVVDRKRGAWEEYSAWLLGS